VGPFLYNLFSDRTIIKLGPSFLQKPLARLISSLRAGKARNMYGRIGGKSPLLDITTAQATALEEALNKSENTPPHSPVDLRGDEKVVKFKVYVGMRYWHPFIEDAVGRMHANGVQDVVGLSLYPHYSVATTGSAMSKFDEAVKRYSMNPCRISSWYDHPLYIDALVACIREGLTAFEGASVKVLFSAHSLPLSLINSGDPYVSHIESTIKKVKEKIDIEWDLSYQSKSGPVKWLQPATEDKIREFALHGNKNVLVVPISFVSDHIETLYEIDILYKEMAADLGIRLTRAESLNTGPLFIKALEELVITAAGDCGWTK
jgi:ferrochelatase